MTGQVRTQLVELVEKTSIIPEDCERDSKAAHDAEIIFCGRVLKERLQHAKRENQRCKGQGDSEDERQVLLRPAPHPPPPPQNPPHSLQIQHSPLPPPIPP